MRSMRSGGAFAFFGYARFASHGSTLRTRFFGHKNRHQTEAKRRSKSLYRIVMSTPRAKPMVAKEGGSAPATKEKKADGAKKKAKPKGSAPTAPVGLGMPMNK